MHPIGCVMAVGCLSGGQHKGVVLTPFGQKAAHGCGGPTGCRHAGYNLIGDACRLERVRLFGTARKNTGIAAFQTHDPLAREGSSDQHRVDLVLGPTVAAGGLADINAARIPSGQFQNLGVNQTIVIDDIRFLQALHAAQGDQVAAARTCANQGHGGRGGSCKVTGGNRVLQHTRGLVFGPGLMARAYGAIEYPTPQVAPFARIEALCGKAAQPSGQ
mmetsp:Transcript_13745/g.23431  ORF Transcript_13745/g.23431 Transcript_13745/m.23431 type:complete len:217 (+) Transcript_13745:612-1262(+)